MIAPIYNHQSNMHSDSLWDHIDSTLIPQRNHDKITTTRPGSDSSYMSHPVIRKSTVTSPQLSGRCTVSQSKLSHAGSILPQLPMSPYIFVQLLGYFLPALNTTIPLTK